MQAPWSFAPSPRRWPTHMRAQIPTKYLEEAFDRVVVGRAARTARGEALPERVCHVGGWLMSM